MSHCVFAIDPGTYSCGTAFFMDGTLVDVYTVKSKGKERQGRLQEIVDGVVRQRDLCIEKIPDNEIDHHISFICEEPLLRGKSNNVMQRLLGALEYQHPCLHYISPSTVKRLMGHGDLDKLQVALAAGELLTTDEEREKMAQLVANEDWDATDAVAIGLCYIRFKGGI